MPAQYDSKRIMGNMQWAKYAKKLCAKEKAQVIDQVAEAVKAREQEDVYNSVNYTVFAR